MDPGPRKMAESKLEPSLSTCQQSQQASPINASSICRDIRLRKGVFIVALGLTALDAFREPALKFPSCLTLSRGKEKNQNKPYTQSPKHIS